MTQQVPCPSCGGEGKSTITREMAIDAESRELEGQVFGCSNCNGDGWILVEAEPLPKPVEITVTVCSPSRCSFYEDGKHQWTEWVSLGTYPNGNSMGESSACKCGMDAFSHDMWMGP